MENGIVEIICALFLRSLLLMTLNGLAPLYLSDLVSIRSSTYSLRSNDSKTLSVPPVKGKKTLGDQ